MAHKIGAFAREHGMFGCFETRYFRGTRHHTAFIVHLGAGEDSDDSRSRFGGVDVNTLNFGVSVRASEKDGVEHAGHRQIVNVSADALNKARVLDPFHGLADVVL